MCMRSWSGEKGQQELNWTMRADWDKWKDSRNRKPHFHCLCFVSFHIPHNSSLNDHTTPTSPHAGRKRLLKQQHSQETETLQRNTEMDGETVRDERVRISYSAILSTKKLLSRASASLRWTLADTSKALSGKTLGKNQNQHIVSPTWCFEQRSSSGYAHRAV